MAEAHVGRALADSLPELFAETAQALRRALAGKAEEIEISGDVFGRAGEGQVILASFLGVNVQYIVKAHGGEELTVICQNTGGPTFGPGQDVKLAWEPEHTFVVAKEAADE